MAAVGGGWVGFTREREIGVDGSCWCSGGGAGDGAER